MDSSSSSSSDSKDNGSDTIRGNGSDILKVTMIVVVILREIVAEVGIVRTYG